MKKQVYAPEAHKRIYYTAKNSLIFQGYIIDRCPTLWQWRFTSVNFNQNLLVAPTFIKRWKLIHTPGMLIAASLLTSSRNCNSRLRSINCSLPQMAEILLSPRILFALLFPLMSSRKNLVFFLWWFCWFSCCQIPDLGWSLGCLSLRQILCFYLALCWQVTEFTAFEAFHVASICQW